VPFPSLVHPACAHRSDSCAAGAPPPSPRRVLAPPSLPRDSSACPQGEQPARTLNLVITVLLLTRLLAEAVPRRHVQRLLVLPRRRDTHGRVRQTALNMLELAPKPLEPRCGQPPHLRRAPAVGPSGATALVSAPGR
jgi:hypothetical protein